MGRRELDKRRANVWIDKDVDEFIRTMSRYTGNTISGYVNSVLRDEKKRRKNDIDLINKIRQKQA